MGLEETPDVGETRVDVLPDVLQLLMLVLLHLGERGAAGRGLLIQEGQR